MIIYYGPPGTGKTTKLISIVEEEVKRGVPIGRIAYISFSKKAAVEAQVRLADKLGFTTRDAPHFRTMHSMAFRATRAKASQMMDVPKFVDFGKKSGFSLKGYYNPDEGVSSRDDDFIMVEQLYRNNRKYSEKAIELLDHTRFVTFMEMYSKYKNTFNFLDFTDLLDLYIENDCFEDVDVAIMDEAQDFTTLQWNTGFRAFRNVKRLYIAGDDDQCIYQWGGADVNTFLKLRGEAHVLDHSYRLPSLVFNKAVELSSLIQNRVKKDYTSRDTLGIIDSVNSIEELDIDPTETTYLLARNNFLLDGYVNYCIKKEIPFLLKGHSYVTADEVTAVRYGKIGNMKEEKVEYIKKILPLQGEEDPKVNISTIHGVKGGEAKHVVIMSDISRGVAKQLTMDEDSEHRVFYVGVTRAQERLTTILPSSKSYYPYL